MDALGDYSRVTPAAQSYWWCNAKWTGLEAGRHWRMVIDEQLETGEGVSQSLCPHWLLTLVRLYKCCFVDL